MTHNPEVFQLCIDIFVERYRALGVDCIAGLDARGFVLGPPIALALKLPFIMIRKKGKLPNAITGAVSNPGTPPGNQLPLASSQPLSHRTNHSANQPVA